MQHLSILAAAVAAAMTLGAPVTPASLDEDYDPPSINLIRLEVFGAAGEPLGSNQLDCPDNWVSFSCTAETQLLVLHNDPDSGPILQDGVTYFGCDVMMTARGPQASQRSNFAVHPSGLLFMARFQDGASAVLRLPDGYPAVSGTGTYQGEQVALRLISVREFAKWQLSGDAREDLMDKLNAAPAEHWISEADCRSLIVHETGEGQREALLYAAETVARMLEEFYAKNGHYPIALPHLTRGNLAVAPIAPGNPYAWPESMTDDLRPKTAEEPGLVYLGLGVSDGGPVTNVGYALGVIGPGDPAEVPEAVRLRLKEHAPAAIKWFTGGKNPPPLN